MMKVLKIFFHPCLITLVLVSLALFNLSQPAVEKAFASEQAVIGVNVPLSGPYKALGQDMQKGYELAAKNLNSRGGVLGRQLKLICKDTSSDSQKARENTLQLIQDNNPVMITGGVNSEVTITQSDICQKNGIVFMAGASHSDATTGFMRTPTGFTEQKAHRHTFRWYYNTWMTQRALTPYLIDNFGQESEFFYLTVDYNWGHSLEKALRLGTELEGCITLGSVLTPLGAKDYKAKLLKAQKANPDVLVLVLFGQDMVYALKQAHEMGLTQKINIVVPCIELHLARELGPEILQEVTSTLCWYWGLEKRFPGSKDFVQKFRDEFGSPPGSGAAAAWVAVKEWSNAATRSGSLDSPSIIRALEGHEFTLLKDEEKWRRFDHQAISSVFIVKGKPREEIKNEWDLLQMIKKISGEKVVRNFEQNPVTLEDLD